jgi:hypothetical protein
MYRMGRLASIQSVMSVILKVTFHSDIFSGKGGPVYSLHDWFPKQETGTARIDGCRHGANATSSPTFTS